MNVTETHRGNTKSELRMTGIIEPNSEACESLAMSFGIYMQGAIMIRKSTSAFTVVLTLLLLMGCGGSSGSNDFRYVAIGASDATGIGAFPLDEGYVFRIADTLNENCDGVELYNLGVPALTADDIENVELPAAVEIEPDFVTVFVGGNDLVDGRSVESFRADVADILQTLSLETDAIIFIANLPDLSKVPRFEDDPNQNVTLANVMAYNSVIESEANATGAVLVNLADNSPSDILVSEDGFHPSNQGHEVIANEFLAQMLPRVCPAA
jgi:lysophospholipase L1-like esterase